MAADIELILRGPEAFPHARKALEAMERHGVWPTPLNFELWINYIADPEGPLAQEIDRLAVSGQAITEQVSEHLAEQFLARSRFNEQIRDAGDTLSRELASVSRAISKAQQSNAAYGRTLAVTSEKMAEEHDPEALKRIVDSLTAATQRVQKENSTLETKLSASNEEVERLRDHLEQVRRDSMTDALTNLANRKAFDEALERFCSGDEMLTVAVLDIDHFKGFNDTWGHQTGDQVLRYVASVLGRVGETVPRVAARYGGEEFSILFPNEEAANVSLLLDAIREEIGSRTLKRRSTNEDLGAVTISIGVAQRYPGESSHALVERADAALYTSKRSGRNRVTNAELAVAA